LGAECWTFEDLRTKGHKKTNGDIGGSLEAKEQEGMKKTGESRQAPDVQGKNLLMDRVP